MCIFKRAVCFVVNDRRLSVNELKNTITKRRYVNNLFFSIICDDNAGIVFRPCIEFILNVGRF